MSLYHAVYHFQLPVPEMFQGSTVRISSNGNKQTNKQQKYKKPDLFNCELVPSGWLEDIDRHFNNTYEIKCKNCIRKYDFLSWNIQIYYVTTVETVL